MEHTDDIRSAKKTDLDLKAKLAQNLIVGEHDVVFNDEIMMTTSQRRVKILTRRNHHSDHIKNPL